MPWRRPTTSSTLPPTRRRDSILPSSEISRISPDPSPAISARIVPASLLAMLEIGSPVNVARTPQSRRRMTRLWLSPFTVSTTIVPSGRPTTFHRNAESPVTAHAAIRRHGDLAVRQERRPAARRELEPRLAVEVDQLGLGPQRIIGLGSDQQGRAVGGPRDRGVGDPVLDDDVVLGVALGAADHERV